MHLTRSEKLRLGAFMLVGAVILVGTLIVLTGLKLWEKRDLYTVSFEENVAGLEVSGQVKYRGFRVGRVDAMRVSPKNPAAIEVTLSLVPGTQLYEGTTAVLEFNGITGLKIINLTPGDMRGKLLSPGSTLEPGSSLVGSLADRADMISLRVANVMANVEQWTRPENVAHVAKLIGTTESLLSTIDHLIVETEQPLVKVLNEVGKSGAAVRELSHETAVSMRELRGEFRRTLVAARHTLTETDRLLSSVPTADMQQGVKALTSMMVKLNKEISAEELGRMFSQLHQSLAGLTQLASSLDLTVRASREDLVMSIKHLRQASQDLRDFSRIIAQDPSVLLRGTEVSE